MFPRRSCEVSLIEGSLSVMEKSQSPCNPPLVCAWCSQTLREGDSTLMVSHGICATCMGGIHDLPVEDLGGVDRASLECLPVGVVRLDAVGTILAFSNRESERFGRRPADVIGRLFFEDVAPCTSVKEFRGRFEEMVQANESGHAELHFVFGDNEVAQQVRVVLVWNAVREVGHVLISMPQD